LFCYAEIQFYECSSRCCGTRLVVVGWLVVGWLVVGWLVGCWLVGWLLVGWLLVGCWLLLVVVGCSCLSESSLNFDIFLKRRIRQILYNSSNHK